MNGKIVEIFTDGACSGNPGPGGWGALLRFQGVEKEISGAEEETTNNRMELLAAITGLRALKERHRVRLVTDSQYLQKGMENWLDNWIRRGWKTAAGKGVLNRDLWEQIVAFREAHDIVPEWVEAHAGHEFNERCDQLANQAIEQFRSGRG